MALWNAERGGNRPTMGGLHGARAFQQNVDMEVRPEVLKHVRNSRDCDSQAGALPAQATEALALAGGGQVLARWPSHNEEDAAAWKSSGDLL